MYDHLYKMPRICWSKHLCRQSFNFSHCFKPPVSEHLTYGLKAPIGANSTVRSLSNQDGEMKTNFFSIVAFLRTISNIIKREMISSSCVYFKSLPCNYGKEITYQKVWCTCRVVLVLKSFCFLTFPIVVLLNPTRWMNTFHYFILVFHVTMFPPIT